jgi:hypothetical protein
MSKCLTHIHHMCMDTHTHTHTHTHAHTHTQTHTHTHTHAHAHAHAHAQVLHALFDAIVPEAWIACSWNVSSLGEWIAGLMQRHEQLSRWIHSRPKSFWITGLFNPAALVIGAPTDSAQRMHVQIDVFDNVQQRHARVARCRPLV